MMDASSPPNPGAPAASAAPPAPIGSTLPPPTPPRPARRTGLWVAIAVVAVVVILLLVLILTGVLPWLKTSSNGSMAFGAQRSNADNAVSGYAGGGWQLFAAAGVSLSSPLNATPPTNLSSGLVPTTNCTVNFVSTASISIPKSDNVSSGVASAWAFIYQNSAGGLLVAYDIGGSVTIVATATGTGCLGTTGLGSVGDLSSNVIDSTQAASVAGQAGGYAFLKAHPEANLTMAVFGGISVFGTSTGSLWVMEYMDCPLVPSTTGSGSSSGATFLAIVSATTGALVQASPSSTGCGGLPGSTPVGSAVSLGRPTEAAQGAEHWYNFSVESAAGGLVLNDLSFQVQSASGSVVSLTGATLSCLGITGTTLATYDFGVGWVTGGSTTLTNTDMLSLETTSNLAGAGDDLVVEGAGSYSGAVSVPIP